MKKSWFYMLFTLATLGAMSVCTAASTLYPVVVNGRWGFVNKSGETVINPQFDRADVFAEGLAPVRMGRWGYVDASGKVAINPQFDKADVFSEGLAVVKLGGGPGPFNPYPYDEFELPKPSDARAIEGCARFVKRVWRLVEEFDGKRVLRAIRSCACATRPSSGSPAISMAWP